MDKALPSLMHGWSLTAPHWQYIAAAGLLSVVVRCVSSLLKAFEWKHRLGFQAQFWRLFWEAFRGYGLGADYLHPLILGTLELLALPVLMATGHWTYVGGWLTIKTVVQAAAWQRDRGIFTRFLIGSVLVLMFAYALAGWINVQQ